MEEYFEKKEIERKSREKTAQVPKLSKASKLRGYLKSLSDSGLLTKEYDEDIMELNDCILNAPQRTEKAFGGRNTISVEVVIKQLINIADVGSGIDSDQRSKCLKILRKAIHPKEAKLDLPSVEWESD